MNKIQKTCQQCNKQYLAQKHTSKFCSKQCSGISKRIVRKLNCKYCEKEFEADITWIKRGAKYCSQHCSNLAHTKKKSFKCLNCGKEVAGSSTKIGKKKFCSVQCRIQFQKKRSTKITFNCMFCDNVKTVKKSQYNPNNHYCTQRCYFKSKFNEDDKEIIELYKTKTLEQIANIFGCSTEPIRNVLDKHKIKRRKNGSWALTKNETKLTKQQLEILEGCLLGDGGFIHGKNSVNVGFAYVSTEKEIIEHLQKILPFKTTINYKPACKRLFPGQTKISQCKEAWTLRINADKTLTKLYKKWTKNGIKIIPPNIKLTKTNVKYWFYGDGSTWRGDGVKYHGAHLTFYTDCFTFKECQILQKAFKKLGFLVYINLHAKNHWVIKIGDNYLITRFYDFIGDSELKCYEYKWKIPIIKKKNNSSKYLGVYRSGIKWVAQITRKSIYYGLGSFKTEQKAAHAIDDKLKEIYGKNIKFIRTNFGN